MHDDDVERICQHALDLPPETRSAFVVDACGRDAALRREVESLLAQATAADRWFETPAIPLAERLRQAIAEQGMRGLASSGGSMTLMPAGARFGPYEISSSLGAGGMGEVYRAHDDRLQREVALKLLPEAFAIDPERAGRFHREAQILAALNHPNIAMIYGLEEANGTYALVLELVEGPTLADRIAQGPVPLEEALAIARQIADALDAAHQKGIIHRDLKPANIKLRLDGAVKVLDFGLAKMLDAQPATATVSSTPSVSATVPGAWFGTIAYMSPEQFKPQQADRLADVWAFGCVLFELLTGRRAFDGHASSEIVAAILKSDPDWHWLPPDVPEAVRRLLRRCLQKNPRQRLHDIADVRIELDEALDAAPVELRHFSSRHGRERAAWSGVVAVLVVTVGAMWALRGGRPEPRAAEMRVDMTTPPTTDPLSLDVSPDGRSVVFVGTFEGRPQLWIRALNAMTARPLPGTDFAAYPFWSPDSRSIGFFADRRLQRLDLDTGTIRKLASIEVAFGGTWTRSGEILFSAGPSRPIVRVAATGGVVTAVTRLDSSQLGHRFPQILPGGGRFSYYVSGTPEVSGVYVANLDGSGARRLIHADSAAAYTAGHLLFVTQGGLHGVRFSPADLSVGNPFSIGERVAVDGAGRAALSATATGPIIFREPSAGGRQQFIWFDRSGHEISRLGDVGSTGPAHPSMAPNGRQVATTRAVDGNPNVWLLDAKRGALARFTFGSNTEIYPVWSPDGSRIVFGSNRRVRGGLELFQQSVTAGAHQELIVPVGIGGLTTLMPDDFSPDGRFLVFHGSSGTKTDYDLWALQLDVPDKPFPVAQTAFEERDAQFSPDGKWIAYDSDESGRFEVYVQAFPGPGAKVAISTRGGSHVRWRHDGKELFYVAPDGGLMAVPIGVTPSHSLDVGTPVSLFATQILGGLPGQGNQRQEYMVSPDGQRFLVYSVVSQETSPIRVIVNWRPLPD